jgi:hypothetical protein
MQHVCVRGCLGHGSRLRLRPRHGLACLHADVWSLRFWLAGWLDECMDAWSRVFRCSSSSSSSSSLASSTCADVDTYNQDRN